MPSLHQFSTMYKQVTLFEIFHIQTVLIFHWLISLADFIEFKR
jgi:hypothetical protein